MQFGLHGAVGAAVAGLVELVLLAERMGIGVNKARCSVVTGSLGNAW
ncbi:MAG: hypothetical protein ACOYJ6_19585 [Caulobacterales bacterium]|jgi:hypothetical protein